MLIKFKIARFKFCLKATSEIRLPLYKGSVLRGGFGVIFKKVVCAIRKKECRECLLYRRCIYAYIFETPPPEDSEILSRYTKIPHPFIIEPPLETKRDYQEGEEITFTFIIIGKAIEYLPYFIYTFDELGRMGIGKGRGNFQLSSVRLEDSKTDNRLIYSDREKTISKFEIRGFEFDDISTSHLALNFITPARIIFNETLTIDLEFHHLIRTLLRRISSLSYFHCGERLDIDFKGLIERAKEIKTINRELRWYDWERYSTRQKTRMKLGGFKGKITFESDLNEFIPFLRIGEIVHIGKGTAFGLGKYMITD